MEIQGSVSYRPGTVALTVLLAIMLSCCSFLTFFRALSLFPSLDTIRNGVAINALFFLSGVHYIGLNSMVFEYDPNASFPSRDNTVGGRDLLYGILTASAIFCILLVMCVISDLRAWLLKTSVQLRQADLVIEGLYKQLPPQDIESASPPAVNPNNREVIRYLQRYRRRLVSGVGVLTAENSQELAPFAEEGQLYYDYSDETVDDGNGGSHDNDNDNNRIGPINVNNYNSNSAGLVLQVRQKPTAKTTDLDSPTVTPSFVRQLSGAYLESRPNNSAQVYVNEALVHSGSGDAVNTIV